MGTIQSEISRLIERIGQAYSEDVSGNSRIADVLEFKQVDHLPLIFWKSQNTAIPGNRYSMKEQFYSKEKMLFSLLEDVHLSASAAYAAPLCIRPNFGTICIPAMVGLDFTVPDHAYPWLTGHILKQDAAKLSIAEALRSEMMQRCIEYLQYFLETVPSFIHVYLPDTQGPFDLAHLIFGDDMFYQLYDDPAFVHGIMEFTTELYCEVTRSLKRQIGEEDGSCFHGHALVRGIYMRNGGVRVSEDTPTLLSPEHIDEFVVPYVSRILDAFDGGFIHYCGKNDHLLEAFLEIPGLRALNLGNPEKHDALEIMQQCLKNKVCYFGKWSEEPGETCESYLKRMHTLSKGGTQGLLLHVDEQLFPDVSPQEIYSIWLDLGRSE